MQVLVSPQLSLVTISKSTPMTGNGAIDLASVERSVDLSLAAVDARQRRRGTPSAAAVSLSREDDKPIGYLPQSGCLGRHGLFGCAGCPPGGLI
jgi:hypothetical protein